MCINVVRYILNLIGPRMQRFPHHRTPWWDTEKKKRRECGNVMCWNMSRNEGSNERQRGGKEASGQNGDFWCGNDWVKSEHVCRHWWDRRTEQGRGKGGFTGPDKLDLDPAAANRLTITPCLHKDSDPSVKAYDKNNKLWQRENLNLFQAFFFCFLLLHSFTALSATKATGAPGCNHFEG